jgi:hypothetical protein
VASSTIGASAPATGNVFATAGQTPTGRRVTNTGKGYSTYTVYGVCANWFTATDSERARQILGGSASRIRPRTFLPGV